MDDAKSHYHHRRRLRSLAGQLSATPTAAGTAVSVRAEATPEEIFGPQKGLFSSAFTGDVADPLSEARLKELFGPQAWIEGPLAKTGAGRRFHNLDLTKPLSKEQAAYVVDALSVFSIIAFPGQDLDRFSLANFERFANHFGAVQPMYADQDMKAQFRDKNKPPMSDMAKIRHNVNAAFPGQLEHLPDPIGSPAVLTVTNVEPRKADKAPPPASGPGAEKIRANVGWHTDQDHERIPCAASMFLIHRTPTKRDPATGTWLTPQPDRLDQSYRKSYDHPLLDPLPPASEELERRRKTMPLNGETAFVDTAAAFAALPKEEQERLEQIRLIKYKQEGDDVLGKGYYCPLVRTNPRSGVKSFYSPLYALRLNLSNIPPNEIEGMTKAETKLFLDKLEEHCLSPEFRYDHLHRAGDLVIWNDYSLLHCAPPVKVGITDVEDARLYYRISTKGPPELTLPRKDTKDWLQENFTSDYTTPKKILEA